MDFALKQDGYSNPSELFDDYCRYRDAYNNFMVDLANTVLASVTEAYNAFTKGVLSVYQDETLNPYYRQEFLNRIAEHKWNIIKDMPSSAYINAVTSEYTKCTFGLSTAQQHRDDFAKGIKVPNDLNITESGQISEKIGKDIEAIRDEILAMEKHHAEEEDSFYDMLEKAEQNLIEMFEREICPEYQMVGDESEENAVETEQE